MESPVYAMARKSQAALELYLGERESTVSFIAHAYSYKDLADERTLNRVFLSLRSEFQGFVDMGLVNSEACSFPMWDGTSSGARTMRESPGCVKTEIKDTLK